MKARKGIVLLALMAIIVSLCAVACEKRDSEVTDNGIVISFETGFDDLKIPSVVSTVQKPASLPETPLYYGYEFKGWYYDKECTRPFSTKDGLKTDTTLYAKWEKKQSAISEKEDNTEVTDSSGFIYRKNGDAYELIGYSGTATEIFMAASYEGIPITGICDEVLKNSLQVKRITVSSSVETISENAFSNASGLKNISVSLANEHFASENGVLYDKKFDRLIAVPQKLETKKFVVKNSVKSIRANAFDDCGFEVELNDDITVLTEGIFAGYEGKYTIDGRITEIRKGAFKGAVAEIVFGEDMVVTRFVNGEFDGYIGKKLVIPGKITSISGGAFADCTAEIDLSATGLKQLGEKAFYRYAGESLTIPHSVESLGSNCFYRSSATVVFDPNSAIAVIGEKAFNQFAGEVTFPKTVNKIERYAFFALASTAKVKFGAKESEIDIDENAFYESLAKSENIIYGVQ